MKAHGETQVTAQGTLIIARFVGSFNADGIKHYAHQIATILNQFDGQPFTMLIDNRELIGGTPDAYSELDAYNEWLNEQALVAKAMLINSKVKSKIITSLSPRLQQQNLQQFDDSEQALAWLAQEYEHYHEHSTSHAAMSTKVNKGDLS